MESKTLKTQAVSQESSGEVSPKGNEVKVSVGRSLRIDRMTLAEVEANGLKHLVINKRRIKRQPGRPRVVPDRRFQFSMSYWYGLIAADYHQLSRQQRVRIALECWKALLSRMKNLPADPNESRMNAEEAMKMLGKLESKQYSGSDGGITTPQHAEGLGAPPVAASPPPAEPQNTPNLNEQDAPL